MLHGCSWKKHIEVVCNFLGKDELVDLHRSAITTDKISLHEFLNVSRQFFDQLYLIRLSKWQERFTEESVVQRGAREHDG